MLCKTIDIDDDIPYLYKKEQMGTIFHFNGKERVVVEPAKKSAGDI